MSNSNKLLTNYLSTILQPLEQLSFALIILLVVQALFTISNDIVVSKFLLLAVPVSTFLLFVLTASRLLKKSFAAFFTPIPIFLVWSAIIFGIGPLYQWMAPDTAERLSVSIFSDDPLKFAWVALLNTVGLLLTVFCIHSFLRIWLFNIHRRGLFGHSVTSSTGSFPANQYTTIYKKAIFATGYIALGLCFVYRILDYLTSSTFVLPDSFSFLARTGWAAIFFLSIVGASNNRFHLIVASLMLVIESALGLINGMRSDTIVPFIMFLIGYYIGSRSSKIFVLGLPLIASLLILITPVVYYVRVHTWGGPSEGVGSSAITQLIVEESRESFETDSILFAIWRRLDYSPWQESLMQLYDQGAPGNTYRYVIWGFVPRLLFPSKPRLEVGTDIGYAVQGVIQASSFSGTVYGEMYWNGGWLYLLICSPVYGILMGLVTIICLFLFDQGGPLSLLIAFNGLLYGFSADQSFSVGVIGKTLSFLGLFLAYIISRNFRLFTRDA